MNRRSKSASLQRNGAMLVMVAVVLIILIVGAVFSVDIAHMHMVRAELQTATDAAARAGAESLARLQDVDAAKNAAIRIADRNIVSGEGLGIRPDEIEVGNIEPTASGRLQFVPNQAPFLSVRVEGRRDAGSLDGEVPLLFGKILGTSTFSPIQTATGSASVRDIALVLDRSGSMRARDAGGGQSRRDALISAVNAFITEIEQSSPLTQISLTTYASNASRDLELTPNLNRVRNQVNRLPARGATNIFRGLRLGNDSLIQDRNSRPFAAKTIVVMTDGNFNVGGSPVPSANIAAANGHTIHTVTFSRGANQNIMREVARIGDGIHLHADNAADLNGAFREIARTISVVLTE